MLRAALIASVAFPAVASLVTGGVGVAAAGDARLVALSVAWALAGLAAMVASATSARRAEQAHVRAAWQLWTAGTAIWIAGALVRLTERGDGHFLVPGAADVLWIAFAIVAIAGVAVRSARGIFSFPLYALDALPVILLLTALSRLGVESGRPHGDAHHALALAYPILFGFLALVSAQFIALQGVRQAWARRSFVFVAVFFLLAGAAFVWARSAVEGRGTDSVSALLWTTGFVVLAIYAAGRALAPAGAIAYYAPKRERGRRSLPPAAALVGLGLFDVLERADGDHLTRWFLLAAAIVFGARLYVARRAAGEVLDELEAERDFTGAVIETAGALVSVTDREGRFVRFNRACEEVSGYSRDEVFARSFYEVVIPPEEQQEVAARVARVHAGDFPNEGENHWMTKSGELRLISWKNTALLDAHGSVQYVVATGIDVTVERRADEARRAAEEKLEFERHLLRSLLEHIPDRIYFKDAESRFLRASRAVSDLLGLADPTDAIGKTDADFFTPEHARTSREDELAVMRGGETVVDIIGREVLPDGGETWLSTTRAPLRDESGEVIGSFGISRDVTALKLVEQALADAEHRSRTLVEQLPLVIYTNTFELPVRLLYVSPQVGALVGYSPEELLARPELLHDSLHPEDRDRVLAETSRWRAEGGAYFSEYRLLARGGRVVWVEGASVIVRDEHGAPLYIQGYLLDVTERKLAQAELEKSNERSRLVAQTIADAICDWDLRTNRLEWSDGITTIFGYPLDEVEPTYEWWLERVHPDDRQRTHARAQADIAAGVSEYSWEYRFRARDGDYRQVWDRGKRPPGSDRFIGGVADVTERKRAEEKLREAEERYRSLVEQLPAIVYAAELGLDGRWLYVSPQVESILGYTQEEWTSSPYFWLDSIHPDDREQVEAYENGEWSLDDDFGYEYRLVAKDGRVVWVRDEATIVSDETGTPRWHHGFLFDITRQKEAEDRLREAEERYRTLVEQLPAIVYMTEIGLDGKWLYVSPQIEAMLGVSCEEWVGDKSTWLGHVHSDDEERVRAFAATVLGTAGDVSHEYRLVAADGRVVWVRDNARIVLDGGGAPRWYQGFMLDITEQRRAEQALRETTAMLESLIEASPVAIIAFDADAHLTRWNPAAERTFGWTAAEVLGRPNPLVGPAEREEFQAFFARAMGGESWRDLEVTRRGRDGSTIELSVSSGPMRSADGTIVGLVSLLADVTERRLAEAERERLLAALAEQNERLLELDTLKDEFVALVSHELRTPLTSIRGYLELIMDGEAGDVTEEQARFLSVIDRNADRLLHLVGDLLLVAQLEAGAMRLDLGKVDLGALAAESVAAAMPSAEKKDIELELELEDGAPLVPGDRSRLAQVLDNVLSNALKFTPTGGRVMVRVVTADEGVVAEVADTGIGMTAEEQELLFQRFFRTEEATRQAIQGTGLGLAISKGIVEAHGGTISVESAPGLGTRFRIVLPALREDPAAVDNGAMEKAA